jgi:hypothetical protein
MHTDKLLDKMRNYWGFLKCIEMREPRQERIEGG